MRYFGFAITAWIGLGFLASTASAQSIENVHAALEADRVLITYDLNGKPDQKYKISLYGSHNNFSTPLRLVSGSIGEGQTPGKAKVVEWRIGEELVTYSGQITFKLRGEVLAGSLSLQSPSPNSVLKFGKKQEIKWTGGTTNQNVRIDLMQNGRVIKAINDGANTGSFIWNVPKDIKKGNYQLQLTSGSEKTAALPVELKAGAPLWVKLSPLVLVGVGVYFLIPKEDPTKPQTDQDLPNAPRPN